MSAEELSTTLLADAFVSDEPPADLWSRIAAARARRLRARRRWRVAAAGAALSIVAAAVVLFPTANGSGETDWQARAQALEIELHSAPRTAAEFYDPAAAETASELALLDGALQAAYDRGAPESEIVPLWKKRSELLTVLLDVRRRDAAVTRI
ncbi:MAG TPA: hypothetical protein VFB32_01800 [Rudaea sp.]|nr:hypothetical protein [Rudaea sp.]